MARLTRRSLIGGSLGLVAAGAFSRPHIANAAAKIATVWVLQGFIPEEDAAFRTLAADYEHASGNKIDYSILPFTALRQKEVAAMTSGVVPDVMETGDLQYIPIWAWNDKLLDVSDVLAARKSQYTPAAILSAHCYNNVTKKRGYYIAPWKGMVVPFHIWRSLVEKAGHKISDIPNRWDAFFDFFEPVQKGLRAKGMRNIYAYGYQLNAGIDAEFLFDQFLIAYGGKGLVAPDGSLHTGDPNVREAAVKALTRLTTAYKEGYVPPGVTNWNDADDNNAFHAKLVVMDFDGTISTELALYHDKAQYDDIVTRGLPLDNDGEPVPSQFVTLDLAIPKAAKNPAVAKEFLEFATEPRVLNAYLKEGLGRWLPPMPSVAQSDPFWLDPKDPHRSAYVREGLFSPTLPVWPAFNPAMGEVNVKHIIPLAEFDVINSGMAPAEAIDKAFKRIEAIFAKYPIPQA
jgi:multiple sugar transport system substrate-binding protein